MPASPGLEVPAQIISTGQGYVTVISVLDRQHLRPYEVPRSFDEMSDIRHVLIGSRNRVCGAHRASWSLGTSVRLEAQNGRERLIGPRVLRMGHAPRKRLMASRCWARFSGSRTPSPSSGARVSTPTLPWWALWWTSYAAWPTSSIGYTLDRVGWMRPLSMSRL